MLATSHVLTKFGYASVLREHRDGTAGAVTMTTNSTAS
jgi:hypothetical protein